MANIREASVTSLTCYRIQRGRTGPGTSGLDQVVDIGDWKVQTFTHRMANDFEASLYVVTSVPHVVDWASYVQSGFANAIIGRAFGPSALLVVRLLREFAGSPSDQVFAFSFGTIGRFLLRTDSYVRGFGLRAALNVIYPAEANPTTRLRAVDTKRRAATTTRARVQASELTDFETFDVNRFRDILSKAAGTPHETGTWGGRITGGDSLSFSVDKPFNDLGDVCRQVERAYTQTDYQAQFDWIDHIQPINDPDLIATLRDQVIGALSTGSIAGLSLAPPEIVDWEVVTSFRYHFDRTQGKAQSRVTRPDIRLTDYLTGLSNLGKLVSLTYERLYANRVYTVDGDGHDVHSWPAWKCLVGEIVVDGATYILDEGDFYQIRQDYLAELNGMIAGIPKAKVSLPGSKPSEWEGDYNSRAAKADRNLLLLDKKTVKINAKTTAIEICDLLSSNRQLIHVKRHLGSADLSHLFAQGVVSACLLQESPEFRKEAISKISKNAGRREATFDFIEPNTFTPSNFEVVYAIAERWNGRTFDQALPFFSKINLREAVHNLQGRGFSVSLHQIQC